MGQIKNWVSKNWEAQPREQGDADGGKDQGKHQGEDQEYGQNEDENHAERVTFIWREDWNLPCG